MSECSALGMCSAISRPQQRLHHLERPPAFQQFVTNGVQALGIEVREDDIRVPVISQRSDNRLNIRRPRTTRKCGQCCTDAGRCFFSGVIVQAHITVISRDAFPLHGQHYRCSSFSFCCGSNLSGRLCGNCSDDIAGNGCRFITDADPDLDRYAIDHQCQRTSLSGGAEHRDCGTRRGTLGNIFQSHRIHLGVTVSHTDHLCHFTQHGATAIEFISHAVASNTVQRQR